MFTNKIKTNDIFLFSGKKTYFLQQKYFCKILAFCLNNYVLAFPKTAYKLDENDAKTEFLQANIPLYRKINYICKISDPTFFNVW